MPKPDTFGYMQFNNSDVMISTLRTNFALSINNKIFEFLLFQNTKKISVVKNEVSENIDFNQLPSKIQEYLNFTRVAVDAVYEEPSVMQSNPDLSSAVKSSSKEKSNDILKIDLKELGLKQSNKLLKGINLFIDKKINM